LGAVLPQKYDFTSVKKADGSGGLSEPLTGSELRSLLASEKNVELIDVRTREEFSVAHIEAAINIPMDEIASRVPHEIASGSRLVIYCHFCPPCEAAASNQGVTSRCVVATTLLREVGHGKVSLVIDDLAGIKQAGVPVFGDAAKLENEAKAAR
jgi:3-mercaptopyruvate sulfurtransferase SseA